MGVWGGLIFGDDSGGGGVLAATTAVLFILLFFMLITTVFSQHKKQLTETDYSLWSKFNQTLMSLDDVDKIIEIGAFSWANIKLIKAGGMYPALQMAKKLSEAGIKVSIGSMMER